MIGPSWDASAENSKAYKEVQVDIYSQVCLEVSPVTDSYGMNLLEKSLKRAAIEKTTDAAKQKYLAHMDGYSDVIRIELPYNAFGSDYGIIYTYNNSYYCLKETLTFELFGMEILWPMGAKSGESFEMELESGEDFIVILRKVETSCQYNLAYMTHPREYEDAELIQKA